MLDFKKWKDYLLNFINSNNVVIFNELKKEQREKASIISNNENLTEKEKMRIEEIDTNFEEKSRIIRETENERQWKTAISIIESTAESCLVRYKNEFDKIPFNGRMANKNFRIYNLFLSFLYDKGSQEWFVPVEWIKRILNLKKIDRNIVSEMNRSFPYIIENGEKKFLFEIHWKKDKKNGKTRGEFIHLKYNKSFDIYFRDINNNFVFYNIEEINNCKNLEEIRFFLYLRKKSWSEKIGGNTVWMTLKKFAEITGINPETKKEKIEKKFEDCVSSLDSRYSVKVSLNRTEKESFAKEYEEKYHITFSTNIENVPSGKIEEDNRKLENEENLMLLKMIFNKDFAQQNEEKIEKLKTEKEERTLYNKSLLKHSRKKKKNNKKVKKETKNIENINKDEIITLTKVTEEELKKPYIVNGKRTKINFTDLEKRNIVDIREFEDGKELAIFRGNALPKGCDRTKFAIPVDIKFELNYILDRLKGFEEEKLDITLNKREINDVMVDFSELDRMSINDAIVYIDKYFKNVEVQHDTDEEKARRRGLSLFYNYFEGTINSEDFLNEIKYSIERNWERLSEGYKEYYCYKAGEKYVPSSEMTQEEENYSSLEEIKDEIQEYSKEEGRTEKEVLCETEQTEKEKETEILLENSQNISENEELIESEQFKKEKAILLKEEDRILKQDEEIQWLHKDIAFSTLKKEEFDYQKDIEPLNMSFNELKTEFENTVSKEGELTKANWKEKFSEYLSKYKTLSDSFNFQIAKMKRIIDNFGTKKCFLDEFDGVSDIKEVDDFPFDF